MFRKLNIPLKFNMENMTLKQKRKKYRLTQEEVAKKAGISQGTLSTIESFEELGRKDRQFMPKIRIIEQAINELIKEKRK